MKNGLSASFPPVPGPYAAEPGQPTRRGRSLRLAVFLMAGAGVNAAFTLVAAAFHAALARIPWDTADSAGRTMGFNDRFSAEHNALIISRMSLTEALRHLDFYSWVLLGMQLVALGLAGFLHARTRRAGELESGSAGKRHPAGRGYRKGLAWFFLAQPFIFPWGSLGMLLAPLWIWDVIAGHSNDREFYIDLPFLWLIPQGLWLWLSIPSAGVLLWSVRGKKQADAADPASPVAPERARA